MSQIANFSFHTKSLQPSRTTLASEAPKEPEKVEIMFLWPYNQYVVP